MELLSIMAEEDVYKLLLEDDDELNDLDIDPELEERLLSFEDDNQKTNKSNSVSRTSNHETDRKVDEKHFKDKKDSDFDSKDREDRKLSKNDKIEKVKNFDSDSKDETGEPPQKRNRFSLEKKPQHSHQQQQTRNHHQHPHLNQRREVNIF